MWTYSAAEFEGYMFKEIWHVLLLGTPDTHLHHRWATNLISKAINKDGLMLIVWIVYRNVMTIIKMRAAIL